MITNRLTRWDNVDLLEDIVAMLEKQRRFSRLKGWLGKT